MRLIDADDLKDWSEIVPLTYDGGIDINDFNEKLESMPTVDAIPIEWIKNYTEENRLYQSDDFDLYISDMIADWAERKEE